MNTKMQEYLEQCATVCIGIAIFLLVFIAVGIFSRCQKMADEEHVTTISTIVWEEHYPEK